jgi:hypothetical protein
MTACGMIGVVGRQLRRALAIVQAKLESWRAVIGVSGWGETAERDQEALRGNRIGNDDAYELSAEAIGPAEFDHHAGHYSSLSIGRTEAEVNRSLTGNHLGRSMWYRSNSYSPRPKTNETRPAQSWRRNWHLVIPFFAFPEGVRRIVYTTDEIDKSLSVAICYFWRSTGDRVAKSRARGCQPGRAAITVAPHWRHPCAASRDHAAASG